MGHSPAHRSEDVPGRSRPQMRAMTRRNARSAERRRSRSRGSARPPTWTAFAETPAGWPSLPRRLRSRPASPSRSGRLQQRIRRAAWFPGPRSATSEWPAGCRSRSSRSRRRLARLGPRVSLLRRHADEDKKCPGVQDRELTAPLAWSVLSGACDTADHAGGPNGPIVRRDVLSNPLRWQRRTVRSTRVPRWA
jgi:hypothetical protein